MAYNCDKRSPLDCDDPEILRAALWIAAGELLMGDETDRTAAVYRWLNAARLKVRKAQERERNIPSSRDAEGQ